MSWRLAFLVNVPVGLVMIYLARTTLRETHNERMKLDATGRDPRHAGLYRGGLRVHPGPRERLAGADHHRLAGRRGGVPHRVPVRRAHRGKPGRPVRPVQGPQPGGHLRRGLPGRRRDVHADGADRPLRAGHPGLQRITRGHRLHPVRDRARHRPGRVLAAGVDVQRRGC